MSSLSLRTTTAGIVLLSLVVSGGVLAAPVVNPADQPALLLAPYAARTDDLSLGPSKAYRPWFENGAWQGDLIEYSLSSGGVRSTDVLVGDNPADAGITNWSARARFDAREQADPTWWQTRHLYSTNGVGLGRVHI